jgi:hypothetical protein
MEYVRAVMYWPLSPALPHRTLSWYRPKGERITMKRIWTIYALAVAGVAIAVCAPASASASPLWRVEGKTISESQKVSTESKVSSLFELSTEILGTKILVTCPGWKYDFPTLLLDAIFTFGHFLFGPGCRLYDDGTLASCKFPEEKIATTEIDGELVGSEAEPKLKLKPKTGTTLAEISVSSCVWEGTYALTGTIAAELSEATKEQKSHNLTVTNASELKLGPATAKVAGSGSVELESGKNWSAS